MKTEFCLSNKEYENTDCGVGEEVMSFWKTDVKEFIKRLKEEVRDSIEVTYHDFYRILDALAGERLTK